MELANTTFTAQHEGQEIKGTVRRASGAERASYLASEAALTTEGIQRVADMRELRNEQMTEFLVEIPGLTVDTLPLPSTGDAARAEWIDMLPDPVVTEATFARLGLGRDLGNSKTSPEES